MAGGLAIIEFQDYREPADRHKGMALHFTWGARRLMLAFTAL
jgi:hypothetical protein